MTCNERLETLLNRAGQTISDLPEEYKGDNLRVVVELKYIGFGSETDNLIQHILHLTDVIDRFEWALENTCNERDYLRRVLCGLCSNFHRDGENACETCIINEGLPEKRGRRR